MNYATLVINVNLEEIIMKIDRQWKQIRHKSDQVKGMFHIIILLKTQQYSIVVIQVQKLKHKRLHIAAGQYLLIILQTIFHFRFIIGRKHFCLFTLFIDIGS